MSVKRILIPFIISLTIASCRESLISDNNEATITNFSITDVIKDFKNDTSVKVIQCIQTEYNFLYTKYCLYRAPKKRVLDGVNKITPKKWLGYIDEKCTILSKTSFTSANKLHKKPEATQFYWNFERLKAYDVYICEKPPLKHYIVFDRNSDTVYHRMQELSE